jgi:hypothetical protein
MPHLHVEARKVDIIEVNSKTEVTRDWEGERKRAWGKNG